MQEIFSLIRELKTKIDVLEHEQLQLSQRIIRLTIKHGTIDQHIEENVKPSAIKVSSRRESTTTPYPF